MRSRFELWDNVERQLAENGNRILMIDEPGKTTSLSEFWELSGRVYRFLRENGITYEDVVMFQLPRSAALYAAMVGTMRAGAAFVLTETGSAETRNNFILRDCGYRLFVDEALWQKILATEPLSGAEPIDLHDKAFIAYTSGTTGHPKGAVHEYGTLALNAKKAAMGAAINPVIPPLDFISSIMLCYKALNRGGTLAIAPEAIKSNCESLISYLKAVGTTEGYLSPSFLRMYGLPDVAWERLLIGSEPADGLMFEGIDCYNIYASTEAGTIISVHRITAPLSPMPVGRGILEIKVLREDGTEADPGEKGELCFKQPYFRGYVNLPEKTAATIRDGWVHSGDWAVRAEDGSVSLSGRRDEQFKIFGYVVNPEEIRIALKNALGLKNVIVRGFVFKDLYSICAFYTDDAEIDPDQAEKALLQYIPPYMVPTNYYRLPALPMLPTGKVNKIALLPPEGSWSQFFDEAICETDELGSGRTARVYSFGKKKAVKLFREGFSPRRIARELNNTRIVHGLGVSCPTAFSIVRAGNMNGILFESFKGYKTYEETLEEDFDSCEPLIREYVRGVQRLHAARVPEGLLKSLKRCYLGAAQTAPNVFDGDLLGWMKKVLSHIPDRDTLVHGDCHTANCFVTENGPVFFDFAFAGCGHPIFDFASVYAHLVFWPEKKQGGKLSAEQCRKVFDLFLRCVFGTEDSVRLAEEERKIRCVHLVLILLSELRGVGMYSEEMVAQAAKKLPAEAEWFIRRQLDG